MGIGVGIRMGIGGQHEASRQTAGRRELESQEVENGETEELGADHQTESTGIPGIRSMAGMADIHSPFIPNGRLAWHMSMK